jgi:hypothetical protein
MWAAKTAKERCKCGLSTDLSASRVKSRCQTKSRRIKYGTHKFLPKKSITKLDYPLYAPFLLFPKIKKGKKKDSKI